MKSTTESVTTCFLQPDIYYGTQQTAQKLLCTRQYRLYNADTIFEYFEYNKNAIMQKVISNTMSRKRKKISFFLQKFVFKKKKFQFCISWK